MNERTELVDTVVSAHRRCASDGNWFDIDRVLDNLEENNAIQLRNKFSEDNEISDPMFDSGVDMKYDHAEILLKSITNMKGQSSETLKESLIQAQKEMILKNGEIHVLSQLKETLTSELAELTACLFEEANRMVSEARREKHMAEQRAKENQLAVSILQEELKVLKAHTSKFKFSQKVTRNKSFDSAKSHRAIGYEEFRLLSLGTTSDTTKDMKKNPPSNGDFERLDTKLFNNFLEWRENPRMNSDLDFYEQVITNDIRPCISFCQREIRDSILSACESNLLIIESLPSSCEEASANSEPKMMHCQLSGTARVCRFKVVILDANNVPQSSFIVCQMTRNRIAAVCELFTFLRHISLNLYASTQSIDLFVKLNDLQRLCAMTRLGLL